MVSLGFRKLRMGPYTVRYHEWHQLGFQLLKAFDISLALFNLYVDRRITWHNVVDSLVDLKVIWLAVIKRRLKMHPVGEVLVQRLELRMSSFHNLRDLTI